MGATLKIEIQHRWCPAVTLHGYLVYLPSRQGIEKDSVHSAVLFYRWVPDVRKVCVYGGEVRVTPTEVVPLRPNSTEPRHLFTMAVNWPLQYSCCNLTGQFLQDRRGRIILGT